MSDNSWVELVLNHFGIRSGSLVFDDVVFDNHARDIRNRVAVFEVDHADALRAAAGL